MPFDREIRRYAAYFRNWAQAFGEHEAEFDEADEINWLYADGQMGFILGHALRRAVFRELLARHDNTASIRISRRQVTIGETTHRLDSDKDRRGMERFLSLLRDEAPLHMYPAYHFMYSPGTRILTFSHKGPLRLIYKEIAPLRITVRQS